MPVPSTTAITPVTKPHHDQSLSEPVAAEMTIAIDPAPTTNARGVITLPREQVIAGRSNRTNSMIALLPWKSSVKSAPNDEPNSSKADD